MSRVAPMLSEPVRQRRPRRTEERHLKFIRSLSCVICGTKPVDPAHLRAGYSLIGKRHVGIAEKPSDQWLTPLCRTHHDEQHSRAELNFWYAHGIDNPWQLCLTLFAASCANDLELAEAILTEHRRIVAMNGRAERRG